MTTETTARRGFRVDGLEISGFKTFPDRVVFPIRPGLTGIVGPNGCGKSNLIDALRAVMGESARQLRGGEMEDVVFHGTQRRPPARSAEISLLIDNSTRNAPAGMNDSDQLKITRRISRETGGAYFANGKPVLLKDLNLLYRDNSTGSSSAGFIKQGQVEAIIRSKPSERRYILEEAAGVSGLLLRKRDSELKLRSSEANLERADESRAASGARLSVLRRQARQAERHAEISKSLAAGRRALANDDVLRSTADEAVATAAFEANESQVMAAMLEEQAAERGRNEALAALEPLREHRSDVDGRLAQASAQLAGVEESLRLREHETNMVQGRLIETDVDVEELEKSRTASTGRLRSAEAERAQLSSEKTDEGAQIEAASDLIEDTSRDKIVSETELDAFTSDLAVRSGRHAEAGRKRLRLVEGITRLGNERQILARQTAEAQASLARIPDPEAVDTTIAEASAKIDTLKDTLEDTASSLAAAGENIVSTRNSLSILSTTLSSLKAEAAAIRASLKSASGASLVEVEPGYEKAVASAFGSGLSVGTDPSEGAWWGDPSLMEPVLDPSWIRLSDHCVFPDHMAVAFRSVVVLPAGGDFDALVEQLPPGASVVDAEGTFAAWNGWRTNGTDAALAAELERANRLRIIEPSIPASEAEEASMRTALSALVAEETRLRDLDRRVRHDMKMLEQETARLSAERIRAEAERSRIESRIAGSAEQEARLVASLEEMQSDLVACDEELAVNVVGEDEIARKQSLTAAAAAARFAEGQAVLTLERLVAAQRDRGVRLERAVLAISESSQALAAMDRRRDELDARKVELEARLRTIAALPDGKAEMEAARHAIVVLRQEAVLAEQQSRRAEAAREGADKSLLEASIRRAALVEGRERLREAIRHAREMLERARAVVDELPADAEGSPPSLTPMTDTEAAAVRERRAADERDLERLGGVNHQAAAELVEEEKRSEDIEKARQETVAAVRSLKDAIAEIEEQSKDLLLDTFSTIDANFQVLFRKVFDGGDAHLRLDGDDVLTAGLEVFAAPPGMLMQRLSLFSGGQQSMMGITLILAAFQSRPAPICILDEADAALDAINVSRLWELVRWMSKDDATRFIVISHRPLTMAQMDRLYGITMQEPGVTTLTHVDMEAVLEAMSEEGDGK
jgi:chromosome segregation protein